MRSDERIDEVRSITEVMNRHRDSIEGLTVRRSDLIERLIADGWKAKRIADELGWTDQNVYRLMRKRHAK